MRLVVDGLEGVRGDNSLFSNVAFSLENGQGLIITGPNGSGKSTLLRIIAGLIRPAQGTVSLCDDDGPVVEGFHYLGALNGMKDQLTVRENLHFWAAHLAPENRSTSARRAPELNTPRARDAIEIALTSVRLSRIIDTPFGYLSTGQKRRVAIAKLAVVHRPVWLVDEPTSGLDKSSEALFAQLAKSYLGEGGILVAATHLDLGLDGLSHLEMGGPI